MKIAAGIIGLFLGVIVLLQSCTVAATAHLATMTDVSRAGSIGMLVALMLAVGGAFAFGLPMVASIIFALAGALALMISGKFGDMEVWGIVALSLACLAFFASWSARQKAKAKVGEAK